MTDAGAPGEVGPPHQGLMDAQTRVEEWISQFEEGYWPPLANLARLVEEVGELATALHKRNGEGGNTSGGDNLPEEFADVLAWLCTLANINDIDLADAVRRKYLCGDAPRGHK